MIEMTTPTTHKDIVFIQSAAPTMKAGEYRLNVTQAVKVKGDNPGQGNFKAEEKVFAVKGERFTLQPSDIYGVFPPNLANGEFDGVLPQVVFNTLTLPWERSIESEAGHPSVDAAEHTPWMAVLTFEADNVIELDANDTPTEDQLKQVILTKRTAKDLVPYGTQITVWGSSVTGTGALPANYLSYPGYSKLDYSETPDDECETIDIPINMFSRIAPSAGDLYYLGHIREIEVMNSEDHPTGENQFYAVLLGNRLAALDKPCRPFLVSLELMSDYLPGDDGTPSSNIPEGTTHVRLVTFRNWKYTANNLDQSFSKLLENLNNQAGKTCSTGLRIPSDSAPPGSEAVQTAMAEQASGSLTPANAEILVQNALNQGYVPMNHGMRHGDTSVSWYRGPLTPFHYQADLSVPISCPDAANRYNPETGLFDVSYGAAWQLGLLLALQNKRFSTTIYHWKQDIHAGQVQAQEAVLLNEKLQGIDALNALLQQIKDRAEKPLPELPEYAAYWLGRLRLLCGVPFNYLVANEQMLPPESIRFFYLDMSWVDTLVDGALSIGRSSTAEEARNREQVVVARGIAGGKQAANNHRVQPRPANSTHVNTDEIVTGFLIRSTVVSGWPRLDVNGYSNADGHPQDEIHKLRMERISDDVLICLFDGDIKMVAIHEAPEALHCGVEPAKNEDDCGTGVPHVTTLRAVKKTLDLEPGQQFLTDPVQGKTPNACVPVRSTDPQTLRVVKTRTNILDKLNSDFKQGVKTFTSAEFALEMIKGVSKVEFFNPPPKENSKWQDSCPDVTQSYPGLGG